ncbi:MAG: succinyl-diaminopimelate desuccinylase [Sinobacteraceae bacterium]|nr:succinyl-diaminopimelate desuccinylase [Nevskiaceae bacterium]
MTNSSTENSTSSRVLPFLQALVARRSLTPDDAGCCELIGERLQKLGFQCERLDAEGVTNLWATHGTGAPLLIFAGHTDVVPPGPREAWRSDPFEPTLRDGYLYGRGAADMKSGLAAMIDAAERFVQQHPDHVGTAALLVTSDEEGPARHGTRHVAELLRGRGVKPDYAIVGEATAEATVGDRIIAGRRGSLGCNLRILGRQGHVAYPLKADNPIHRALPALAELTQIEWDRGNAQIPPTSLQISNLHGGTGANNVIPGSADVVFNFRYGTASDAEGLKTRVTEILDRHLPHYEADWWHSGLPYSTSAGALIEAADSAIEALTGQPPRHFTGGGTSDGRFLAPLGAQVIEIGPVNASIHKVDENTAVAELDPLSDIHLGIVQTLLRG